MYTFQKKKMQKLGRKDKQIMKFSWSIEEVKVNHKALR